MEGTSWNSWLNTVVIFSFVRISARLGYTRTVDNGTACSDRLKMARYRDAVVCSVCLCDPCSLLAFHMIEVFVRECVTCRCTRTIVLYARTWTLTGGINAGLGKRHVLTMTPQPSLYSGADRVGPHIYIPV